jgi:hypothetical protein
VYGIVITYVAPIPSQGPTCIFIGGGNVVVVVVGAAGQVDNPVIVIGINGPPGLESNSCSILK